MYEYTINYYYSAARSARKFKPFSSQHSLCPMQQVVLSYIKNCNQLTQFKLCVQDSDENVPIISNAGYFFFFERRGL